MKGQFSHELFTSFSKWFEAQLISDKGLAYITNQDNSFQYVEYKDIPPSHYAYQGKFRGLVQDHSVSVPNSGIFIDGGFVSGDNPNILIDYENGRIIVPSASGTCLNITANNTVKEIHVYPTEDDETQLIISSDFVSSDDEYFTYLSSKTEDQKQTTYLLPACFLRYMNVDNNNFSFGGEDDTQTRIRATILAKDNYLIDGVLSLFSDLEGSCIKHIPFEDDPYGAYNSIKSFPYTYSEYVSGYGGKSFIKNVKSSKLDYGITMNKIEKNVLLGFIDFDLSTIRFPMG